eukprot:Sspe_Gene.38492::Locus_18542_Transcript_1_1_Confidence_1.000_Length_1234::g.38492::m.38492
MAHTEPAKSSNFLQAYGEHLENQSAVGRHFSAVLRAARVGYISPYHPQPDVPRATREGSVLGREDPPVFTTPSSPSPTPPAPTHATPPAHTHATPYAEISDLRRRVDRACSNIQSTIEKNESSRFYRPRSDSYESPRRRHRRRRSASTEAVQRWVNSVPPSKDGVPVVTSLAELCQRESREADEVHAKRQIIEEVKAEVLASVQVQQRHNDERRERLADELRAELKAAREEHSLRLDAEARLSRHSAQVEGLAEVLRAELAATRRAYHQLLEEKASYSSARHHSPLEVDLVSAPRAAPPPPGVPQIESPPAALSTSPAPHIEGRYQLHGENLYDGSTELALSTLSPIKDAIPAPPLRSTSPPALEAYHRRRAPSPPPVTPQAPPQHRPP